MVEGLRDDEADERAREIGRRQSVFREVNERIEELAEDFEMLEAVPILCECGWTECKERIELTQAEYERLRLVPTHFAVVRGHEIPEVERVVEETDGYVVVEKFGDSAEVAIAHDPRNPS